MPKHPRLTRRIIADAPFTDRATRSYYLMEAGGRDSLRGFGVRVHRQTKVYVVRRRREPHVLGRVDIVPLEEARERARRLLLDLLDDRHQPARAGRRKTIAELAQIYLDQVVAPRNKPRTLEEYQRLWRLHLLPRFGALRLHELAPHHVLAFKTSLRDRPVAANRALQQLSAAFAFAKKMKWVIDNPADERTVDRYTEAPVTRALEPQDYARLGTALREAEEQALFPVRTTAAIRLLLLTGARPDEILSCRVEWVKLGAHPHIHRPSAKGDRPGQRPKGRKIWLDPETVGIIQSIPRPPDCPWLIPADKPGEHLKSFDKAWARLCKMAGISGTTPKSARHSFRSAGPEAGIASEHMKELLGHASSKMTDEVYWHARDDAQAGAAATIIQHLGSLLRASANQEPGE